MNFSLQNIQNTDSSVSCKLVLNEFIWKGKFKVNYKRDSLHALSILVVLSDSGKVIYVQSTDEMLHDIEKDSATGKYLSGVIPDQMSESAITDMLNRIFSIIPSNNVQPGNTWISDITLVTNHPAGISNFNVLKSQNGDTTEIEIQSHAFARPSPGDEPYIQENQAESALVSYSTGILFCYSTQSEIITKTSFYDVHQLEKFILKLE